MSPAKPVRLAWLDADCASPRWGWVESLLLALWLAAAGWGTAQHLPWADEMQAWLLAGGQGWRELFLYGLHYEGSGGLWHASLKLMQACGVSFTGMRWIALCVEGGAMALLLACAPLPRLVRWLLPFTFFLFYQDAIVARSYCLFAVLAFTATALLRSPRPRPFWLALSLGLLANLSVHGAVASIGLAVVAAVLWRRRFFRSAPAVALLLLLWTVDVFTIVPAFDIDFAAGNNLRRSFAHLEGRLGLHASPPPSIVGMPMANLQQAPIPPLVRQGSAKVKARIARILAVVTFPLASSRVLALLLAGLVMVQAAWAGRPKLHPGAPAAPTTGPAGLVGLAPYGCMLLVFSSLYLAPRHTGTLFTGFVVSAWLTWPQRELLAPARIWLARSTAALFAVACIFQIGWSVHALAAEHAQPYGPGAMTAEFLKQRGIAPAVPPGKPDSSPAVAGYYYFSLDPLLYFDRNIYVNQPPTRYWQWSTRLRSYSTVQDVLVRRPPLIVVGGFENGPQATITRDWEPVPPPPPGVRLNDTYRVIPFFETHGYHVTHVFCGHSWMRTGYAELLCDTVLQPVAPPGQP